jgi:hypothetical protein
MAVVATVPEWNREVLARVRESVTAWTEFSEHIYEHFQTYGFSRTGPYALARLLGSSTLCAAYAAHLVSESPDAKVIVVTMDKSAVERLRELVGRFVAHEPTALARVSVIADTGTLTPALVDDGGATTVLVDNFGITPSWPALATSALGFGTPSSLDARHRAPLAFDVDWTQAVWRSPLLVSGRVREIYGKRVNVT